MYVDIVLFLYFLILKRNSWYKIDVFLLRKLSIKLCVKLQVFLLYSGAFKNLLKTLQFSPGSIDTISLVVPEARVYEWIDG